MKKGYGLIEIVIIIVVTSIISALATGVLITKNYSTDDGYSYAQLANDENVQDFLNVYSKIVSQYYENVDKKAIIDSAINGMTNYLDDTYTSYLDEDKANNLKTELNKTYVGIGIVLKDNVVVNIIENSPAHKAGIISGDIVTKVNGNDVTGISKEELAKMINENSEGANIVVTRNDEILEFDNIKPETLNSPSITYNIIENDIAYMKISIFSNTLSQQINFAITELNKHNMNKLIIDLRDNTGGYLEQAYESAELFLEKGKVVYSLIDKNNKIKKVKDETEIKQNIPVIILVNNNTASAAEIFAAALKDSYGATIVGKTTFGKGKVQHTYSLDSGGLVKYTSSKWLRPNGQCIDNIGIIPDYDIDNNVTQNEEGVSTLIDNQYNKAVELLKNQ